MANFIKCFNFRAACQPKKVFAKVSKLFKNVKSVKVGKMRPEKKKGDKEQWRNSGWVNIFSVKDFRRAMIQIEKKETQAW